MIEDVKKNQSRAWKKFARRHSKMIGLWIVLAILFAAGALYVFIDFAQDAQESGLVPTELGDWSVGHIFSFVIELLIWEVLIIGIPLIISLIAMYMLWWKSLPLHEREEYDRAKLFESSDGSKGSGFISLVFNVMFMLRVYWDGNWDMPISQWTFDYFVETGLWVLMVFAIVAAIPLTLGALWYFSTLNKPDDDKPCSKSPCGEETTPEAEKEPAP